MTKANKKLLIRLIISLVIWICAIVLEFTLDKNFEYVYIILYSIAYIIAGYDVLIGAVKHILSGEFLDELFLMSIATIGAFLMRIFGDGEYLEAVAVMIFFQVGEIFQGIAVEKSRKAILDTMDLKVTTVTLDSGEVLMPEDVKIGDVIVVKPGEMVPLDGYAKSNGVINVASLTGEAVDKDISEGEYILSGSINQTTPLYICVDKIYNDSTATKILDMVENATMKKAKSEKFITKFARIYTPIVVLFALLLAVVPPTIIGFINGFSVDNYQSFIKAALTCLVVSCPCALVVSIPLTYFAGIGAEAKTKIIVKGASHLEDLANVNTFILDKTGTLTKASFEVDEIYGNKAEVMKIAKGLEKNSTHPLALAINKYEGDSYDFKIEETPGYGIIGYKDDVRYICGSKKLLEKYNIKALDIEFVGSILYIAKGDECIGAVVLVDTLKEEATVSIKKLISLGKRVVVLSGDTEGSVKLICDKLGIKEYYSSLLPQDKVALAEKIIAESDGKTVFVGDGINDAPVLALSDVGVSMGQIGSDAALEASDVVILNDDLKALPNMVNIALKTRKIVIENIIISLIIKIGILLACGLSTIPAIHFTVPMWVAIIGDVGVLIIAVLNAMRALKTNKLLI